MNLPATYLLQLLDLQLAILPQHMDSSLIHFTLELALSVLVYCFLSLLSGIQRSSCILRPKTIRCRKEGAATEMAVFLSDIMAESHLAISKSSRSCEQSHIWRLMGLVLIFI